MKMVSEIIANILNPNSALFIVVRVTVISSFLGGKLSRPSGDIEGDRSISKCG